MFNDRPLSLAQQILEEDRSRPMSAMALDFKTIDSESGGPTGDGDVDMVDNDSETPSSAAAAPHSNDTGTNNGNTTFFDAD